MDTIEEIPTIVEEDMVHQPLDPRKGEVSSFSAPEFGGTLWQIIQRGPIRFRCQVGSLYNGEIVLAEQSEALEPASGTVIRTVRDKSILASHVRAEGNDRSAERFEEHPSQVARSGRLIRLFLLDGESNTRDRTRAAVFEGAL